MEKKRGRSEWSENIKIENKSVVRRSERIAIKLVWSREEEAVYYRTTQIKENIES